MIASVIILGSVALALVYSILWCVSLALRQRIEAPGHRFAEAARRYDRRMAPGDEGDA